MNQLQRTKALQRHLRGQIMQTIKLEIITDYGTKVTIIDTGDDYLLTQIDLDAEREIERRYYARDDEGLKRAQIHATMCA